MNINDFIDMYNYEMVSKKEEEKLDAETLQALREIIQKLIVKHVDDIEEAPAFEFIDDFGRIKLS